MAIEKLAAASGLDDILVTAELAERGGNFDAEAANQAFVSLAEVMADAPEELPQKLCDVALQLCYAGTAGLSILKCRPDGSEYFYWEALSGVFKDYVGGTTPRDFSPCGTSIDRRTAQVFSYPSRFFGYLEDVSPAITEALVVPFFAGGQPLGAIWILSHDEHRFSRGDAELMEQVGKFTAAALHLLSTKREADRLALDAQEATVRLTKALKAKDEFFGLVSHELKTPITTILGYSSVLTRWDSLAELDKAQALADIHHDAQRLDRMVSNLLALARADQGKRVAIEPVLVPVVIDKAIKEHKRLHPQRQFSVREGTRQPVYADQGYLEQVLVNLFSNAEKYSPSEGVIEVEVEAIAEDWMRIAVADRGVGIGDDELEKIFEPFYRSDRTKSHDGVGIGLTVCRRLIDALGGTLQARNRLDGGTIFEIALNASPLIEP